PRDLPLVFDKKDEALLFVLEDISEGPAKGMLATGRADFLNILSLLGGRRMERTSGPPLRINEVPVTTHLRMELDSQTGELVLSLHTELPFLREGEVPAYLVTGKGGWAYGAGNLWPLANVLPEPYQPLYEGPMRIARQYVLKFLDMELPLLSQHARIESEISRDLFTIEPAQPRFCLNVRGSPASLAATLRVRYGELELVAAKPDPREHFGIPDPEDLMRYTVRNMEAERRALQELGRCGFRGEVGDELSPLVGNRLVLNFLGSTVPVLRRKGWQVVMEGRIASYLSENVEFATPVVQIHHVPGMNWFEVGLSYEDKQGLSISPAEIQLALRRGESYLTRDNRTILIDSEAVESLHDVFRDCASLEGERSGRFRVPAVYTPFVKSALDGLDGVDVECPPAWRAKADQLLGATAPEPVSLGEPLDSILRSYQKQGVSWLRFLEQNGFCGLLADEMGLGKTLQALAWLQLPPVDPVARGKPALVVCPSSLTENWADEAARFVPHMRVLLLTGPDRHEKFAQIPASDLVITSYAILRRDTEDLAGIEFSTVILDEAQHIKNRSTQNARAAKSLRAVRRLVLTGTPVENSVSDIWSIMDFLMPGYLGSHETFRQKYELEIARGGPEGEAAQLRLKRKLQPFLLRRLKKDVSRDLPPKIEKISLCSLTAEQQAVYAELLASARRRITDMVAKQGLNRARMEILTTLLRLRQVCCHVGLLNLPGLHIEHPSAKLEQFWELLDEALDGGHRVLVFSQFVAMLTILRRELESRDIRYCYLDGTTKERLKVVQQFNREREIPVFLISLKAGGTGLNLTGADMVIHFDPWWNPAVEDQATDRAHRIGQRRTVYSIKLITRGTVEEKVLELQARKKAVINATVQSEEDMLQTLTWSEIREILNL
ncbi:MAG: SNF2 family helicase, partial [Kiritimatiellae bacterium]|nr:SNF2 family helicase [Kiritimatiellia bacterium]